MYKSLKLMAFVLYLCGASAYAQSHSVSGTIGPDTYARPSTFAVGQACTPHPDGAIFKFGVHTINHPGGILRLEVPVSASLRDPYLILYANTFDPLQPCTNAIAADDDAGEGLNALLNVAVAAGSYQVVVSEFSVSAGTPSYTLTVGSPVVPVPTVGNVSVMLGVLGILTLFWRRRSASTGNC